MLVLLFLVAFWALRGFKALAFLARYKVKGQPQAAAARSDDVALSIPQPQVGVR